MASCNNCLHGEACEFISQRYEKLINDFFNEQGGETSVKFRLPDAEKCPHFKDRSRFVELPCKVGDTVYSVHGHPDYGYKIEALQAQDVALICSSGELSYSKRLNYFGKTVFLTKEEAEQALTKRNQLDNTPQ